MESQQEIQQLVQLLQSYQETIEVLNQQQALLQSTIEDHRQAHEALSNLDELDEEGTIMIPLGGQQFVHASIEETDKVLSSVGAGVVVEEDLEGALERSKERIDELQDATDQIEERIEEVTEEAQRLQQRAQELQRGQQM